MPRLAVVFDTNIYRALGTDAWRNLLDMEANHSIIGHASYAVLTELFAQLADPSGPDHGSARAALCRLWEHCTDYNGSQYNLRLISRTLPQVAWTLFDVDTGSEDDPPVYGELAGRLANEPGALEELRPVLQSFAKATDDARKAYAEDLWARVVLTLAPGAKSWADLARPSPQRVTMLERLSKGEDLPQIAAGLAQQAATFAGLTLDDTALARAAESALKHYGTVVHYRSRIVRRLIERGPDMTKRPRANGVVDTHVCASTSNRAALRGIPLILVTDDEDILEAASLAKSRSRVLGLPEYRSLIDSSAAAMDTQVDLWMLPENLGDVAD